MRAWSLRIALVFAGIAIGFQGIARAETVENALMPGRVIQGHADIEPQCKKCHMPFNKAAQKELCLDCHKDVAKDMAAHRGFHGRLPDGQCRSCHTEHKGRRMNIAPIDARTFDHGQTEFPLRGAHARAAVKCRACHVAGKKFREAPSQCIACHRKDDAHKGRLGELCVNCHTERSWKQARFDHSKTRFPLDGKHVEVACKSCHLDAGFRNTPTECYACHKKNDKHKGRFGTQCKACHTDRGWRAVVFDHGRDTKYVLRGKHRTAKCESCHAANPYRTRTPTECVSCHRKDDKHKGGFGAQCRTCHVERGWPSIIFDHDRSTTYALRGQHRKARCASCHAVNPYQHKTATQCIACHQKDDKHRGQEGKRCAECHNEASWRQALFDHGLTSFPLLGKHAKLACKECHASKTFKDAPATCNGCHRKDDPHKRRLGTDCGSCHNASNWRAWSFDHNKRTHFVLDGAHKGLNCVACHTQPMDKVSASTSCVSCHDRDDAHDGSFGRFCERCHVTSSFKRIKPGSGMSR